jgi:TetR/AcrR family transcriptional repressor of nem operon
MKATSTVREQILDHSVRLIMRRGHNGFSYRDLSALVGVKTSSIHYYFPQKDDLILEAVNKYSETVLGAIHAIDNSLTANVKLTKYTEMFGEVIADGEQICLCGILAADIGSLSENVRHAVQAFFKANEKWLEDVLHQGTEERTLTVHGEPSSAARALFAAFLGGVISSRLFHTKARLSEVDALLKIPG